MLLPFWALEPTQLRSLVEHGMHNPGAFQALAVADSTRLLHRDGDVAFIEIKGLISKGKRLAGLS